MPGDSGVLVVTRVRSTPTKCTRDRGCSGHPAFPTPSSRARDACITRAHRAARSWTHNLEIEPCRSRIAPALHPATVFASNSSVIPGCATWRRPGIHTPGRGYGFRARASRAPERRQHVFCGNECVVKTPYTLHQSQNNPRYVLRPQIETLQPAAASACAMPNPMPPLPPVITATRPVRSKMRSSVSIGRFHFGLARVGPSVRSRQLSRYQPWTSSPRKSNMAPRYGNPDAPRY
jgi:hypothetical protein